MDTAVVVNVGLLTEGFIRLASFQNVRFCSDSPSVKFAEWFA